MPFPSSLNPHKHLQCQSEPQPSYLASLQNLFPCWIGCCAFSKKEFKEPERARKGGAVGVNVLYIHVLTQFFFIYRELQTSSYREISGSGIQISAIRMGLQSVWTEFHNLDFTLVVDCWGINCMCVCREVGMKAFDVLQKHRSPMHTYENYHMEI